MPGRPSRLFFRDQILSSGHFRRPWGPYCGNFPTSVHNIAGVQVGRAGKDEVIRLPQVILSWPRLRGPSPSALQGHAKVGLGGRGLALLLSRGVEPQYEAISLTNDYHSFTTNQKGLGHVGINLVYQAKFTTNVNI